MTMSLTDVALFLGILSTGKSSTEEGEMLLPPFLL